MTSGRYVLQSVAKVVNFADYKNSIVSIFRGDFLGPLLPLDMGHPPTHVAEPVVV